MCLDGFSYRPLAVLEQERLNPIGPVFISLERRKLQWQILVKEIGLIVMSGAILCVATVFGGGSYRIVIIFAWLRGTVHVKETLKSFRKLVVALAGCRHGDTFANLLEQFSFYFGGNGKNVRRGSAREIWHLVACGEKLDQAINPKDATRQSEIQGHSTHKMHNCCCELGKRIKLETSPVRHQRSKMHALGRKIHLLSGSLIGFMGALAQANQ